MTTIDDAHTTRLSMTIFVTDIDRRDEIIRFIDDLRARGYTVDLQETGISQRERDKLAQLSRRERAVLESLAAGKRPSVIAQECYVSMPTVRTQIRSIFQKLGVNSQIEAVALLLRQI